MTVKCNELRSKPQRKGFSLVEMLTCIAVLGILLGLTLVAIHAARESARKIECANRLRQIAVANQDFVGQHRHFPGNGWGFRWIGQPERGVGPLQPGGWAFQLLPFLQSATPATGADEIEARQQRALWCQVPRPAFKCPSRPDPPLTPHTLLFEPVNAIRPSSIAKTDFAVCEGDIITDTQGGPASLADGDRASYPWINVSSATGISFRRSQIAPASISDGLSNTCLVGEKHVPISAYNAASSLGHDQSLLSGVDVDITRWVRHPPIPDRSGDNIRAFGSAHLDSIRMAMCDGSVRAINYEIDRRTFVRMGNRHDGRVTEIP